jgi:hypothetical protein
MLIGENINYFQVNDRDNLRIIVDKRITDADASILFETKLV